jgi:hypothetical protein
VTGKTEYSSNQGIIYSADGTELWFYPARRAMTQFVLPDNVTTIKANAFINVPALQSIILPDTLASIEENAFKELTLTELVIPNDIRDEVGITTSCCVDKLSLHADTFNSLAQSEELNIKHLVIRQPNITNFYYKQTINFAANYLEILEIEADTTTAAELYAESSSLPNLRELSNLHTLIIHNGKERIPNYIANCFPATINCDGGKLANIYVPYDCELFYESTWESQDAIMISEDIAEDPLANIIKEYEEVANKDWLMNQLLISKATDSDIADLFK